MATCSQQIVSHVIPAPPQGGFLLAEYLAALCLTACLDAFLGHWLVLYEAFEYGVELVGIHNHGTLIWGLVSHAFKSP